MRFGRDGKEPRVSKGVVVFFRVGNACLSWGLGGVDLVGMDKVLDFDGVLGVMGRDTVVLGTEVVEA